MYVVVDAITVHSYFLTVYTLQPDCRLDCALCARCAATLASSSGSSTNSIDRLRSRGRVLLLLEVDPCDAFGVGRPLAGDKGVVTASLPS